MAKTSKYTFRSDSNKSITVPIPEHSSRVAKSLSYIVIGVLRERKPNILRNIINENAYLNDEGLLARATNAMQTRGNSMLKVQDEVYVRACIHKVKYLYGRKADELIQPLEGILKELTA
jgi:hypothetical protein